MIDSRIQEKVAAAEQFAQMGPPASEKLVFELMSVGQQ